MAISVPAIDALIKEGALDQAARALRKINRNEIPRTELAHLSSLATRAGEPELAIRWLNPIVRAERKLIKPSSDQERAEYGVALTRIGAHAEALGVLETVSSKDFPQTLLFRAITYFPQWDYRSALPLLEKYLQADIPEYQRTVGLVNQAAALIFEAQFDQAEKSLTRAILYARTSGAKLLLGNCFELSAQLALGRGDLKEATRYLHEAGQALREGGRLDSFFVRKWTAVVQARKKPGPASLEGLELIRKEARELQHWESVRDCDFYRVMQTRDPALIAHLFHGTPFARFRSRILSELGEKGEAPPVPTTYDWVLPFGTQSAARIFDLTLGEELSSRLRLKPRQVPHRLLRRLALDFYRPASLPGLYAALFPDDFYHPEHSANRMHQALSRLRVSISRGKIPLVIGEDRGTYYLDATQAYAIRTRLAEGQASSADPRLERLRSAFSEKAFSSKDAARCLGVSPSTAVRFLLEAAASQQLTQNGRGRACRYYFKSRLLTKQ